jgi:5-deoxy-glucuronate isomerase
VAHFNTQLTPISFGIPGYPIPPMSQIMIRAFDNENRPILAGNQPVDRVYFNLVKLAAAETHHYRLPQFETIIVPLAGTCDVTVDKQAFSSLGGRADVWDGKADSVYAGPNSDVVIVARSQCEIAIAGGLWDRPMAPFRIPPDEVAIVDVGSNETKSRRRIFHILGQNGVGRAGNLLVSELYADEGCWSGYPPHKHDTDQSGETAHQELYYWRFNPAAGFGAQLWYTAGGDSAAHITHHGDTFAFSTGYHPTVTSPYHESYIFTILVGKTHRSLIQNFDSTYRHLMQRIPGIEAMREKFR